MHKIVKSVNIAASLSTSLKKNNFVMSLARAYAYITLAGCPCCGKIFSKIKHPLRLYIQGGLSFHTHTLNIFDMISSCDWKEI